MDHAEDPRDDEALLADHVAGDTDAFGILARRHRDRMWAVALRTTGDPEEAADALQDALVKAFRAAPGYRSEAAVTTWLHRIVVNACLDRLRRRKVRHTEPLALAGDESHARLERTASTLASSEDPASSSEQRERRDLVVAGLRRLPPDQAAALVLVDMEGYPVAEAAQILSVPPGTVKSRCARGRARLAALLADLRPDQQADLPGNHQPTSNVLPPGPEEGRTVP